MDLEFSRRTVIPAAVIIAVFLALLGLVALCSPEERSGPEEECRARCLEAGAGYFYDEYAAEPCSCRYEEPI